MASNMPGRQVAAQRGTSRAVERRIALIAVISLLILVFVFAFAINIPRA